MTDSTHIEKDNTLGTILNEHKPLGIAFSGGVDSTFLAIRAHEELGVDMVAFMVLSPLISKIEREEAEALQHEYQFNLEMIELDPLHLSAFEENPLDRCYHCKKHIFETIKDSAARHNITTIADGTNLDDSQSARPGLQALSELSVISPLAEAHLSKEAIRQLSGDKNLRTANKPAFACLATRIPHGTSVTKEKLAAIETVEAVLHRLGFNQYRARYHENLVRIEIDMTDFHLLTSSETRQTIVKTGKEAGFKHVTLDLRGYEQS